MEIFRELIAVLVLAVLAVLVVASVFWGVGFGLSLLGGLAAHGWEIGGGVL